MTCPQWQEQLSSWGWGCQQLSRTRPLEPSGSGLQWRARLRAAGECTPVSCEAGPCWGSRLRGGNIRSTSAAVTTTARSGTSELREDGPTEAAWPFARPSAVNNPQRGAALVLPTSMVTPRRMESAFNIQKAETSGGCISASSADWKLDVLGPQLDRAPHHIHEHDHRSISVGLQKPSEELSKALRNLGVTSGESLVRSVGFADALRQIVITAQQSLNRVIGLRERMVRQIEQAAQESTKAIETSQRRISETGRAIKLRSDVVAGPNPLPVRLSCIRRSRSRRMAVCMATRKETDLVCARGD